MGAWLRVGGSLWTSGGEGDASFRPSLIWVFLWRPRSKADLRAQQGLSSLSCPLAALSGEKESPSLAGCSHFLLQVPRKGCLGAESGGTQPSGTSLHLASPLYTFWEFQNALEVHSLREKEQLIPSAPTPMVGPIPGLELSTLRSTPELRLRVGGSASGATQVPPGMVDFYWQFPGYNFQPWLRIHLECF